MIRSSRDKSTSLPARCYLDFSLPRPGLFHTTVHTTGVQSIQYARLAGRRSLKRVLLVEVRYDTAFLQPSANSFGTLCVVKEDGEIEHLPPSRRPLDRPTGTRDQQANEHADQQANDDSYHSPHGAAPEVSAIQRQRPKEGKKPFLSFHSRRLSLNLTSERLRVSSSNLVHLLTMSMATKVY